MTSGTIYITIAEEPRNGNPTVMITREDGVPSRKVAEVWKLIEGALEGRYRAVKAYGRPVHPERKGA